MSDPMLMNYIEEQNEFERLVLRYLELSGVKRSRATLGRLMMYRTGGALVVSILLRPEEKEWNSPTFEGIWANGPVSDKHRWRDHLDELRRALILDTLADV